MLARLGDQSASAVVMDCRNGEVLAMTTTPSFDPSLFNSGVSQAQWVEWTNNRKAPLINKATAGVYPPGSTFKMAVAMAGLDNKVIGPGDRINCPGYIDVGDTRFHCWSKYGHGSLDVRGGLKNSCDVFFFELARRVGIDRLAAMANRFGIGVDLDIELPGARRGLMPTRAWRQARGHPWGIGDTVNAGIGQGYVEVTPLALCTYVSRVATGRAVQPHMTRTLGGVAQPGAAPADWPSMNLSERHLQLCREGMYRRGERGGRHRAARPAGDARHAAGGQDRVQPGAPCVARVAGERALQVREPALGIPPARPVRGLRAVRSPRYAVSLVVEHGNAGAAAAAPLAREIMVDVLTRDPVNRVEPQGQKLADRT